MGPFSCVTGKLTNEKTVSSILLTKLDFDSILKFPEYFLSRRCIIYSSSKPTITFYSFEINFKT